MKTLLHVQTINAMQKVLSENWWGIGPMRYPADLLIDVEAILENEPGTPFVIAFGDCGSHMVMLGEESINGDRAYAFFQLSALCKTYGHYKFFHFDGFTFKACEQIETETETERIASHA